MFGPSGWLRVSLGTLLSDEMYWSVPPSVCPTTTGRTPRRVMVEAEKGVRAATRGAAWAGAARTAVESAIESAARSFISAVRLP